MKKTPTQDVTPSFTSHLTENDVALRFRTSVKTVQSWRARGCGPRYMKLSAAVRYRLADIEEYEAAHERQSTSEQCSIGGPA